MILIIDICPGSSTHPKVVFKEALHPIELEFGNLVFEERGKPENPEKNHLEQSKEPTTNLTHSCPESGSRRWEPSIIIRKLPVLRPSNCRKLCTTGTISTSGCETDMDSLRGQPNPGSRVRAEHIDRSTGQPLCIYGDPAYPLRVHL